MRYNKAVVEEAKNKMGGFISPMLAKPLPAGFDPAPGEWVVEEKLDGHRIVVQVTDEKADLFGGRLITAWSRYGIERFLPSHIVEVLQKFPVGVYDGELLVPGKRSYGTVVIENSHLLVYKVFDALNLLGKDLTSLGIGATQDERRAFLTELFKTVGKENCVELSWTKEVSSMEMVVDLAQEVWAQDGEGLILKKRSALYEPAKRPRGVWLKIKKLQSSALTVVAFRQGKLGPNSIVLLRDEDGNETTVKWKNFDELAAIDADPGRFIGRKLRIEFQERTTDGSYRHPRWDRWEDE
jgi:ATP-dependent DNA ligase